MAKKKKNMKESFKKSEYYFLGVYVILSAVLLIQIFLLDILPLKISIPVIVLVVLALLGMSYLLVNKKINKSNKRLAKILTVLISLLLVFGNFYIFKTYSTIGKMTGDDTNTSVLSVVVLEDSSYEELEDLKDKKLGIITIGDKNTQDKALKDLNKEVYMDTVEYDSYIDFANDLYNGKVDAILVNEGSRGMFEDRHPNFDKDTRIIKQFTYSSKAEDISKKVDVTEEPFNIYITGIDTYGTIANVARSDVNMIMTVNPKSKQILLTSIPRDYYVKQPCQGNQEDKLTHTGIFGVSCTTETAEQFFGIDINYYARVNFSSLVRIVDAVGGIEVDSPFAFTTLHGNYNIKQGINSLNGEQALGFVRERYSLAGGDRERGKNQMRVMSAIIKKAASPAIVMNYGSFMDAIGGSFQTNMSQGDINALIKMQLDDMSGWNITQYAVNGSGLTTFSPANGFNSYVMVPEQNTVDYAIKLIKRVHSGEVLSESDGIK